jgi:hypothetical protein
MPAQADADNAENSPRGAISPLVPVLVPIAVAAIIMGFVFTRLFPFSPKSEAAPSVRFTDVTRDSGLEYSHDNGVQFGRDTPTTLPGAVAFLDYDNDGHPDLFFVGGISWPWNTSAAGAAAPCALYHNDGRGHFTDVTRAAGLDVNMLGMGVAVGDYDGDGFPDIFVTGIGGNRLFHNQGNGTFVDVTDAAGVRGDDHLWSSGAVWIDIFGDGKLDLVVCNYARWAPESSLQDAFASEIAGPSYTAPSGGFVSAFPTVYRNLGNGKFVEISAKTGLNLMDRQTGYPRANPLAVAAVDANGDGRLGLLFSYQTGGDTLFLNQGDGTFRLWIPPATVRREGELAGLVGGGALAFARQSQPADRLGVLRASWLALTPVVDDENYCHLGDKLGVALLDYDLDGRMDIVSTNALAEPGLAHFEHGRDFPAAPSLLWNNGHGWVPGRVSAGETAITGPLVARGIAVADVYGNGKLDIVIAQNGGPPRLLRNDQKLHNSWLRIDLVGTRCQRDAGGARVEVHTPSGVLVQTMEPAMGFMAQSEKTLTFGLGGDDRVRKVVVRWPDGAIQEVHPSGVNRRLVITEPL